MYKTQANDKTKKIIASVFDESKQFDKSKVVSMRFRDEADKAKNIIIFALKLYANNELNRQDSVTLERAFLTALSKAIIDQSRKTKNVDELVTFSRFARIKFAKDKTLSLREACDINNLRVDSESTKLNLSNHDRSRISVYNRTMRILADMTSDDKQKNLFLSLVKEYSKKTK